MDFKKAIIDLQPYFAIAIFILLMVSASLLYQNQQIEKEIRENCGWGEDNFYCSCEKSEAMRIKNEIGGFDVPLVG